MHSVRLLLLSGILTTCGATAACSDSSGGSNEVDGIFSQQEWAEIQKLSPLPAVPADPTNAHADSAMVATFGQKLFFEKSFSGALAVGNDGTNGGLGNVGDTGKISCSECHDVNNWFQDTRSQPRNVTLGANWLPHRAPSLVNACFYTPWYHWDGKFDSMWGASIGGVENPSSFNSTRLTLAHAIYNKYKADYNAVFMPALDPALDPTATDASRFPPSGKPKASPTAPDGPWEMMAPADQDIVNRIMSNVGKALQAYIRQLTSKNAPFDQYVAGNHSAISTQAKLGLQLFIGKAACTACHSSPFFSDNKFHNTGVPQNMGGPHAPMTDLGRYAAVPTTLGFLFNSNGKYSDDTSTGRLTGLSQTMSETGQFRTKDLRQVAEVGPYMHAGQFATLADVLDFYNKGGGTSGTYSGTKDPLVVPLNLTSDEQAEIVAFLQTLTGDPIPMNLRQDTSNP
ncbi:MAG TPA: cytochrome c peroxidase [Polyangiaceae bacterium]